MAVQGSVARRPSVVAVIRTLAAVATSSSPVALIGAASEPPQGDAAIELPLHSHQSLVLLHSDSEHFREAQ